MDKLQFWAFFSPRTKELNDANFISSIVLFYILSTKNALHMFYNEAGLTISKHGAECNKIV
ncbi:hypothetical protein EMIT074MI3_11938 [Bacillus licheniformis]|nr:hypothetical protein BLHB2_22400 [Bacillus licheniformis]GIN23951.1 hypothetical protein J31TS2_05310 [Bacillus licheniformis]GIN28490.1 hypothetical protein J2TS5_05290 [Bacillus licheniformis]